MGGLPIYPIGDIKDDVAVNPAVTGTTDWRIRL
jgi:hypothetical protein